MTIENEVARTLAEVLAVVEKAELGATRRRDLISAITCVCKMLGTAPEWIETDVSVLRKKLGAIRPVAFGISAKTWSTRRSGFSAALELAGAIDDMARGQARRDPVWGPLARALADDKRLSNGLAAFMNWCSVRAISPEAVTDETVQQFHSWLETRTLHPKPTDLVCGVPRLWNEARDKVPSWPCTVLTRLSFRPPRIYLSWQELSPSLKADVEAYIALRAEPDLFDDSPTAPRRPIGGYALRQQSGHLRASASILVDNGVAVENIASLADLVAPEHVKIVLRHFHAKANGKPNSNATQISKTLVQVAKFHVKVPDHQLEELKRLASKLPSIPFDLTDKNKALMMKLESDGVRTKLLYLPEDLLVEVNKAMNAGLFPFVKAQMAIAIDVFLVAPLRPHNLCALTWARHFLEPEGPKGRLILHIPADETKSRRKEYTIEIDPEVARRLRWYRHTILPRLKADPGGPLFVTKHGTPKSQETLSQQLTEIIEERVGIHMTPHTFRHFAAVSYLEDNPEDFETARAILGHAWGKTTLIYAGSSSRRAGAAYAKHLLGQREKLKSGRSRKPRKPSTPKVKMDRPSLPKSSGPEQ
jgi:integrase